jgi:uncharacterized protein YhdP
VFDGVQGEIRRNELGENRLTVSGNLTGPTSSGLEYLRQASVRDSLKATFAKWQVAGDFLARIGVMVPLNLGENNTTVRLGIELNENTINIPDYGLEVNQLSGPVVFDTTTGLEPSQLTGQLFGQSAEVEISSQSINGQIETMLVNVKGSASPESLMDWPLQSGFVRDLLAQAQGLIDFSAELSVDQSTESVNQNRLVIDSDLTGASFSLPYPFAKTAPSKYPLHVEIEFGNEQSVSGSYGSDLVFDLKLLEGAIEGGVVYLGAQGSDGANLFASEIDGLAIVGELNRFVVDEWTDFFSGLSSIENPAERLADNVAFADILVGTMELYEQELPNVAIRIEPDDIGQGWLTKLASDSVQGWVTIPYLSEDYLQIDLDYLHLQGEEEEKIVDDTDLEEERIDVLARIDPRSLPHIARSFHPFLRLPAEDHPDQHASLGNQILNC